MVPVRLDHLVLATPDLAGTAALFADLTGVMPAAGGQHLGRGTANRLVGLSAGGYLEIIGPDPDQPAPGSARPFGIDALTRPRLVTWAIRTADLQKSLRAAHARGYQPGGAQQMSRRTAGGELLTWRLTYHPAAPGDGLVPFLIDWGASRHPTEQPLPAVGLASLEAVTPSTDLVSAALRGLEVSLPVRRGLVPHLVAVLAAPQGDVVLS